MLVHDDFIFTHMQKTGGTSIKENSKEIFGDDVEILGEYAHLSVKKDKVDFVNDRKIIGSVRNPFSWYSSLYFHYKRNPCFLPDEFIDYNSFEEFLKFILMEFKNEYWYSNKISYQKNVGIYTACFMRFFWKEDVINSLSPVRKRNNFNDLYEKAIIPDYLIQVENFEEGYKKVMKKLGLIVPENYEFFIARKNNFNVDYSNLYNDFMIDLVNYKDEYILNKFDYSFKDIQ